MELSLTTFILEIVNFLVLVWILKRLFFAPVKKVIEERKAAVAKTLKDAQETKTQAEALKVQYEGRLKEWEGEKVKGTRRAAEEPRRREIEAFETDRIVSCVRARPSARPGREASRRKPGATGARSDSAVSRVYKSAPRKSCVARA